MVATKYGAPWAGWILLGALGANVHAEGDSTALNAALKQVTAALGDVRGVVADVEYAEVVNRRPINGTGKVYVNLRGAMRAEIGGDEPRTILFLPPNLYVYRPADKSVKVNDLTDNPDRLAQYLMLGFSPAGSAMKKAYDVRLVDNATLEGKPVLSFLLTPKSKKAKDAARAIARIQLWVDPATGLPAQHQIVHSQGVVELNVRFLNATRDDALPDALFRPQWPEGTKLIRK